MSKKVLGICNTPFQIICISWIRRKFYPDAEFDLIITDQISGAEQIVERAKTTGFFHNVTLVCDRDYSYWRGDPINHRPKTKVQKLKDVLGHSMQRKRLYQGSLQYDELLIFNHSRFALVLFEELYHRNPEIEVSIYEEGIGCYHHICRCYYGPRYAVENASKKMKNLLHLLRRPCITDSIRRMFVFIPELLTFHPPIDVVRIPPMEPSDNVFVDGMLTFFGCADAVVDVPQKIILFEESYATDGWPFSYTPVMDALAKAVDVKDITVKRHPRSKDNEFEKYEVAAFPNGSVPWEVLLLKNPDLAQKTWVSYCSGSMLCAYFYLNLPVHAVSLMDIVPQPMPETQLAYFKYIREKLFAQAPRHFCVPSNGSEFEQQLSAPPFVGPADLPIQTQPMPAISVVLGVYNGAKTVSRALDSVLEADFQQMEVICIDDGSTDETYSVLEEYRKKDPRVVVIRQPVNTGLFLVRCNGIRHARGEFITFMDADDFFRPGAIQEIAEKAMHYDADVFHFAASVISEDEKNTTHVAATARFHSPRPGAQNAAKLLRTTFMANAISRSMWSKAFRRTVLQKSIEDVDDTRVDYGDDAYLTFRMFYYAQSYYGDPSGKQYYVYRYSPDMYTNQKMTVAQFQKYATSWGRVSQKCRQFLEDRGELDTYMQEWKALSENILLRPTVHMLVFRVADAHTTGCIKCMMKYWDVGIITNKMKQLLRDETNRRIAAERSHGYRLGLKVKKLLRINQRKKTGNKK